MEEDKKVKEIKFIIPENGEKLSANADELHKELLKLPAEMYVDLYHTMKSKMENNCFISNGCISAGSISSGAVRI